ncbi:transglutaminase-like domain-containing protein [Ottowia sp. SB7-C50]|uniref:SirB1 family protein n=1 Tax=Ottowia sp. SB7-C50 TaxID=3081231 RepID=UPI002954F12A|nr:transglutaminase-like domain-containing protein [Ottowia sp. SB7-C50]WOP14223.1 transglutaminase-like domain-containing protein [Ottowia sp. SB7-C50]
MQFDFSAPTPLAYFASLVQRDEGLPLLEAAATLGQDDYPDLDVQQVMHDIDQLADRLRRRVAADADPMERLRALGQFFFGDLGFAGNVNDYYNPDNSLIHVVLHTRRGIPISLAVLWLELAQGLGLRAEGVGFPGHFLVQVKLAEGRVVIDPFTGQSLDRAELRDRVEEWRPDLAGLPRDDRALAPYLRPVGPRLILARMLRNLQDIHRTQEDWRRFVRVQDRLVTLLPEAWVEYRDRGLALAELGEARRAAEDLALYLRESGDASDRDVMASRLRELGGHAR